MFELTLKLNMIQVQICPHASPFSLIIAVMFFPFQVLFVTSHPDDETMFFGPTMLQLTRQEGTRVMLLCFSRGDYR